MKIVRYQHGGQSGYGVLEGETVRALEGSPFAGGKPGKVVGTIGQVKLLAPVENPPKIIGIGSNYISHLVGYPQPEFPLAFMKPNTALVGPDEAIVIPKTAGTQIDYEAELVVVMGKTCRGVSEAEALDYVLGYSIGNDVSAREWQSKEMANGLLLRGKGFDTFAPLGPAIETELDIDEVVIEAKVNGELKQRAATKGDMLFPPAKLIASLSEGITLQPGDLIYTGTTVYGTVGDGDVLEFTIDGIGTLRNPVRAEG